MNTASDFSKLTVLVVDDDDFSLELVRGVLEDLGVRQVALASSAKAAINTLDCLPKSPDLLVCDLYMPDMDGFEFMGALVDRNYSGSLVLCSGVSIDNLMLARDFGQGMGLKLLGAYQKPIPISEFQRILESLTG
jgi:CheY-like chemotaxis protein